MHSIATIMLLIVAAIHVLPLLGAFGEKHLSVLYGICLGDPNLAILMRHRAVLFGLLGAFLFVAALTPPLRLAGFVAGAVSVGSFLLLAWHVGGYNDHLRKVFVTDGIAGVCLVCGLLAHFANGSIGTVSASPTNVPSAVVAQ
ncbi:MAG: phosphopantetheine adenylyltransferase [Planctomycetaceae bacterium]